MLSDLEEAELLNEDRQTIRQIKKRMVGVQEKRFLRGC